VNLGIIGFGGMGSWIASRAVDRGYTIIAYDVNPDRVRGVGYITPVNSIREVLEYSNTIIVSTPLNAVIEVLGRIRTYASELGWRGAVCDISTFKKSVIQELSMFPEWVKVGSLHPLFGPRARNLEAHKVLIVPVPGREGDVQYFKNIFEDLGLKTIIIDARVHDRIMGLVIGLPYAIGNALARILSNSGLDHRVVYELSGTTFKALYILLSTLGDPEWLSKTILEDPDSRYWIEEFRRELGSRFEGELAFDRDLYKDLYCLVEDCLTRGDS